MRAHTFEASLTEMLGGKVALTHTVPSFSSGRNSVPRRGTSQRLTTSAPSALASTVFRW